MVKANPVSLFLLQRYSVDVEYLPVAHLAIVFAPHYWRSDTKRSGRSENSDCILCWHDFEAYGAEVGMRYYTSHEKAAGFYIGPTLIGDFVRYDDTGEQERTLQFGVDLGGQMVFSGPGKSSGVVLGFGGGIMFARRSTRSGDRDTLLDFPLRFIAQVGYSF